MKPDGKRHFGMRDVKRKPIGNARVIGIQHRNIGKHGERIRDPRGIVPIMEEERFFFLLCDPLERLLDFFIRKLGKHEKAEQL